VVKVSPAAHPIAVLLVPVVIACPALTPTQVLEFPVVSPVSEALPIPVLLVAVPEVNVKFPADCPTKVLTSDVAP
jgi:hypothetical protein